MILTDLHVHTCFSDGCATPEETVLAAIEKGMACIGFSDHSYTDFDESYCISKDRLEEYRTTITGLKEKYEDRIQVLCGIEQDLYSLQSVEGYDYVIGSLHYVKAGDTYISVDYKPEILIDAVERYFGGDMYSLLECYYRTLAEFAEKAEISVIGHFDLVAKFNEKYALFNENHPRYVAAWQAAAQRLLKKKIPFEINTGAISRGWRTEPYPAKPIWAYIRERGGKFILSSDSHSPENLCFQFQKWEHLL